jgi:hypothetical protein
LLEKNLNTHRGRDAKAMHAAVKRLTENSSDIIARFPWGGWIGWLIFCGIALARVTPRRFASTFTYYIEAAERLLAHGQVYDRSAPSSIYRSRCLFMCPSRQ